MQLIDGQEAAAMATKSYANYDDEQRKRDSLTRHLDETRLQSSGIRTQQFDCVDFPSCFSSPESLPVAIDRQRWREELEAVA